MDVTTLFKESVKTVSLRNKELSADAENFSSSVLPLKKPKTKCAFSVKAQAVTAQISKLREFLLENRKAYLNVSRYLSAAPRMTDAERDEIDSGAQKIMVTCSQLIKELKREIAASDLSQQNVEHREIVVLLIEDYLKNVCRIYSEQKAKRIKRTIEMRKIARLQWDPIKGDDRSTMEVKKPNASALDRLSDSREDRHDSESSPMKIQEINGDVNTLMYEELSPEDIQMFQSENEQLYNELALMEEVKQIESKVVHIAELQEMFTEKVLDQDKDLDRLMTTVVGSTENVKEANEQIRQAIQRNAGLRVWVLFFLLVMSFTLLFLDWYNP